MIPASAYSDQHLALFGLAASGLAAAQSLVQSGAQIDAWDDNSGRRQDAVDQGLNLADLYKADWSQYSALVLSPGVPLTHPEPHAIVQLALEQACPILGDIELFAVARRDLPENTVIAVTGTNGKSTTTALIAHIVNSSGGQALACGNIGQPVMALDPIAEGGVYVVEMSSYQIDLTHSLMPELAILLNIGNDHLDRHGSVANYAAVKTRLLKEQAPDGIAIIGVDDEYGQSCAAFLLDQGRHVIPVSVVSEIENGIFVRDGVLFDCRWSAEEPVLQLNKAESLPGRHNWQNAAAAYAAANALGYTPTQIQRALNSFPGLAHRSEVLAKKNGINFVNDSKATNVAAAARALDSFENIHWIAGGRAKEESLENLDAFSSKIIHAYLIGEAQQKFADYLKTQSVPHTICNTLDAAFSSALRAAVAPATILLSPACASFDQFEDFEARGNHFRSLVESYVAGEIA